MSKSIEAHLRFAPDILRRLGEELISSPYLGIMELVRNSYDADAHECTIELINTDAAGGTLRVTDDGIGMDEQSINTSWLVLGSSNKKVAAHRISTPQGRLPIGDKGLGRLAALRMGSRVAMHTRPRNEPDAEYSVVIDWSRYDNAPTVDNVALNITKSRSEKKFGTDVEVQNLHTSLTERNIQQLARSLVLMADPFGAETGFNPVLKAPAYTKFEQLVKNAYFDEAEYKMVAVLDATGRVTATIYDWKKNVLFTADHATIRRTKKLQDVPYCAPSSTFELWTFNFGPAFSVIRGSNHTIGEQKEWLKAVGGVHIYQRNVRVHPYGDPSFDWLDMNLRRSQTGEESPSTNNSIGRVVVNDVNDVLVSKTDRTGFIENHEFTELKQFATDALRWMLRERLRAAEARRIAERQKALSQVAETQNKVDEAINIVPQEYREAVSHAVHSYTFAREQQVKVLREEVQLYRTLATVGTTVAVFAHEAGKPLDRIGRTVRRLEKVQSIRGLFASDEAQELLNLIKKDVQSLESYSQLPVQLLQHSKRQVGNIDVHSVLQDVVSMLQSFLQRHHITVQLDLSDASPTVPGSVAALECVFVNLITNASYAVAYGHPQPATRQIHIRSLIQNQHVYIEVADNGPGIEGLSTTDIWLPGRTTKEKGLGLGLTIVKDAVTDLGGSINAIVKGWFGGAQFNIFLPIKEHGNDAGND